MGQWLSAAGYLVPTADGWKIEDQGEESINPTSALVRRYYTRHPQRYRENTLFIGDTSPFRAVYALEWLLSQPPRRWDEIEQAGHRNGARSLINLRLIRNHKRRYVISQIVQDESKTLKEFIWEAALKEPVMELVIKHLRSNPTATGEHVGQLVAEEYERNWTPASVQRIGNGLRQWAVWLIKGIDTGIVPKPPGRRPKSEDGNGKQLSLQF